MSVWYKVAWIPPLFAAVDAIAPARGHGEDGTIGDLAHATGVSGHNPDDTPGVTAERQDADSKPEVRAADVDNGGTWPAGRSMENVVQAVLHGPPAERDRLIYIIYNRRIWKKSNGWRQEAYSGSDPHDRHAHFSGDPAADDNGGPWTSILALEDDMGAKQDAEVSNANRYGYALVAGLPKIDGITNPDNLAGGTFTITNWTVAALQQLTAAAAEDKVRDTALAAAVQALAVGSGIDVDGLMKAVNAAVSQAVQPLIAQIDAANARAAKFAQAMADAGVAFETADDV